MQIYFECWPQKIQTAFAKEGIVIDLSGDQRTKNSFGFIKNNGTWYSIITYYPVNGEQLWNIQRIVMELEN